MRANGLQVAADQMLRTLSPSWRSKRKYEAEREYWRGELDHLYKWFVEGTADWWGIRPPAEDEKQARSDLWITNAVMTIHQRCPHYTEELRIERDAFAGQRVLEVGCGPLAPLLQFTDCTRHCLDPLTNVYMSAGWPLYDYDAKIMDSPGERMPYETGYFDAVISVNALDHVDDFEQVAFEMQRVVKPGGHICFEVEYHRPTETEPVALSDRVIQRAFSRCAMQTVINRSGRAMVEAGIRRFDLVPDEERFRRFGEDRYVTWHGIRGR